jgi:hypothetical protein
MSSLFNQTNIAPGTPFATGGGTGGSNFPSGVVVGNASPKLIQSASVESQIPGVCFFQGPTGSPAGWLDTIYANGIWCFNNQVNNNFGLYNTTGITYSKGLADTQDFIQFDPTNIVGTNDQSVVYQVQGISSMQSGQYVVNANKLFSTLIGVGYG